MDTSDHASNSPLPARRSGPSRRAIGIAVVALAIALAVAVPALRRHSANAAQASAHAAAPAAVPVRTAHVAQRSMDIAVSGVGGVLPVSSVTVRTRIDGQLDRVDFKEGQDVKAGQVLAHLDARTFEAQVQQIEAQRANHAAQLANAQADLRRYNDLIKEDATTRQTLDTQAATVRQLQATLQNDDAQLSYARVQLGFATIKAPISGRVGARLVDPGNIVHTTDAAGLVVINQIDPIAVQFSLPESQFQAVNAALRTGQPLRVQAIDRGTREVLGNGDLVLLNNQIDVATGTIALKAQFANAQHTLWPGQSVDARLVLGAQANALTVPSAAVQRSQDGLFAYVVGTDNKVRAQPIEVSGSADNLSIVGKGLSAGERVVVDGQYLLAPGALISETPAKSDETGAAGMAGQPGATPEAEAARPVAKSGARS